MALLVPGCAGFTGRQQHGLKNCESCLPSQAQFNSAAQSMSIVFLTQLSIEVHQQNLSVRMQCKGLLALQELFKQQFWSWEQTVQVLIEFVLALPIRVPWNHTDLS